MTMLSREQATASDCSVMADGPIVVAFNSMSNEERERVGINLVLHMSW